MIVVIDSNVWISALISASPQSKPRLAVKKAIQGGTVAICDPIEDEIVRVAVNKFGWTVERVRAAMAVLLPFALRTNVSGNIRVCRDPNDDMVLECAIAAEAEVIVTGDKDLLILGKFQGIAIMSPVDFLEFEAN